MIRRAQLAVFAILLVAACQARAADVFGFELGVAVELRECEPIATQNPRLKLYSGMQQQTCIEDPTTDGERVVHFVGASTPRFAKERRAKFSTSRGALCAVQYYTWGLSDQDAVLEQLRASYGAPSSVTKSTAQNLFGAAFRVVHARWKSQIVDISFDGVLGDIETGDVTVRSLIPACSPPNSPKTM